MATPSPELRNHQEWLGYIQQVGLVVSPPALLNAQAYINRNVIAEQETLRGLAPDGVIADFPAFTRELLGWEPGDLAGAPGSPELPATLEVVLPDDVDRLAPTFAVPDPDEQGKWLLLVLLVPAGADLDSRPEGGWHATYHARLERLLKETAIPAGLLVNGASIRLVYAPKGESSGHLTFRVSEMCQVAGRPLLSALLMLLGKDRLFVLPKAQRLPALLSESRKYQNVVSTKLAEQVLDALYEMVRGFQAADEAAGRELLRQVLAQAPSEVYGGLLTTLLRLVFVLYAEDRGLLPGADVFTRHYSVAGLFERLRDDDANHPDTMDQRYGAWAQLLTLFRLLHDGAAHGGIHVPARHGRLFDPDAYPFLEGRPRGSRRDASAPAPPPRVSDGTVYRVLDKLLVLDGERLSYRALDVEQIGSVYEALMGFELRVAAGRSVAVRPDHVVVDLDQLLALAPSERAKRLKDEAKCDVAGGALEGVKSAKSPEDLVAALGRKVSPRTPAILPAQAMLLQPTEERRRSGSHYTPRSLTEPIVATTLKPILVALGPKPKPEQILDLKVCDPAMGSGAFLVETCRHLGEALVAAWEAHGQTPKDIPPDEDVLLHARRLVAQRCLYGVDKNPFAVDLAKLSLWLATLAEDHPFTFLDHNLRCGDSLVGLTRQQIASFDWKEPKPLLPQPMLDAIHAAEEKRAAIAALGDGGDTDEKARLLAEAERALADVRLAGDLVIAAFFGAGKEKEREALRLRYEAKLQDVGAGHGNRAELGAIAGSLRNAAQPLTPFHWQIEFPEVFSRETPGFDAFVGNPPFLGSVELARASGTLYTEFLRFFVGLAGKSDVVAFRLAFAHLRQRGAIGLLGTNTISQGDTRAVGLTWICENGGVIYHARKRIAWPGAAAVVASAVHISKGRARVQPVLGEKQVERITAFLLDRGGNTAPEALSANGGHAFRGTVVWGMGFTFDDESDLGTPIAEMNRLIATDPRNADRIRPYIGGEELNDSPALIHRRYVIDFGDMSLETASRWPDLLAILDQRVRPDRENAPTSQLRERWWQFGRPARDLYGAIAPLARVLCNAKVAGHLSFAFLPREMVFADTLNVFAFSTSPIFALLQSRVHENWARCFGSSFKDDLRYAPTDVFETFPLPPAWEFSPALEHIGHEYYDFRAALMISNNEGLTATYNRFHDPDETSSDILRLRDLHAAMDLAVLDAYGWNDIRPTCKFLLDYEEDDTDDDGRARKRKKPWRYRWPDDIRDEVLARLLALNKERAEDGHRTSREATPLRKTSRKRAKGPTGSSAEVPGDLFRKL